MAYTCPYCGVLVEPLLDKRGKQMVLRRYRKGDQQPAYECLEHGAFLQSDCRTDVLSQKDKAVGPDDIPW